MKNLREDAVFKLIGLIKDKKASFAIIFFQFISLLLTLFMLRFLLDNLSLYELGIWLTLISIVNMLTVMDGGISNGLRNRLTALLATKQGALGKIYVSSAFCYMLLILVITCILTLFSINLFDWGVILNIKSSDQILFTVGMLIVSSFINIYFMLSNSIAYSLHKPVFINARLCFHHILFLLLSILFLNEAWELSRLHILALCYFMSTLVTNVIGYIYIINRSLSLSPKYSLAEFGKFKEIGGVGLKFLVIQLSVVILFGSDSLLVAHLFEVDDVAIYNSSNRIFLIFIMLNGAFLAPLWGIYTEKLTLRKYNEIRIIMKRSIVLSSFISLFVVAAVFLSDKIMMLWFGSLELHDRRLFFAMGGLTIVLLWSSNFSTFLNGIGRLKLQMICSGIGATINIPLSIILVKYCGIGIEGITYATIISICFFCILAPIAFYKIIIKK